MKAIKHLLWMLIALSMSISFASCGGDDDNPDNTIEKNVEAGKSAIVGKWERTIGGAKYGYRFNENGTGNGYEYYTSSEDLDSWPIQWAYNNSTLIIKVNTNDDKGGDIGTYDVKFLGESSMSWTEYDDNGKLTTKTTTYRKVSKFFWE